MLSVTKLPAPNTLVIFFFLFCVFTLQHFSFAIAKCHKNDMAGLLDFKSGITEDPHGLVESWIPGTDCCSQWMGVNCGTNNRVKEISLDIFNSPDVDLYPFGYYLTGTISSSLSKLRHLRILDFRYLLNISGTFPSFLLTLKKLEYIDFQNNKLYGPIPPSIGLLKQLRYLRLSGNQFWGQIPSTLSHAPKLVTLDLSWNSFSGTVPKTFANLTSILNLDLSHNLFVEPFPDLKGIQNLDLSYNQFHLGQIPKWVTLSRNVSTLNLAKCGIKMKLENWKPVDVSRYELIDLSDNEISGSPIRLLNQTRSLIAFSASGNRLKFNMKNLKFPHTLMKLDLSRNLVFGSLRKSISGIRDFNVSYNHLCGPIPATSFSASVFVGNDCLCGSPLSPCRAR